MTVIRSDVYTGKQPMRTQPITSAIIEIGVPFVFPVAAPVIGDLLLITKIPMDTKVVDWILISDDLDSNAAPTAAWSLGEANAALLDLSANVYKAGIIIGQTAGLVRTTDAVSFLAVPTNVERTIALKWTAAALTYVPSKTGMLILKLAAQ